MDQIDHSTTYVHQMLEQDAFSRWLGLQITEIHPGRVSAQMKVRSDMLNGFNVCHGGVTFAFADSVLAFASNTHGKISVSIDANMSYPNPVYEGDVLTAESQEVSISSKVGMYTVTVTKQDGSVVGIFRGTVYRTQKEFTVKEHK